MVDIGRATEALGSVLAPLRYADLDAVSGFEGKFTTTEFLCRHIFEGLAAALRAGGLGDNGRVRRLRVTLAESHVARAWYEAAI